MELTGTAKVHKSSEIEEGVIYGKNVVVWRWSHIRTGTTIGDNVMIGNHVDIGKNVIIGNNCRIQNGAQIPEGVMLGDNVFIGANVSFNNVRKPKASMLSSSYLPTIIKTGATICANAVLECGITVGEKTTVKTGCVVHKDIPDKVTVVGNPARITKHQIKL